MSFEVGKLFKRNDIILIGAFLLLAILLSVYLYAYGDEGDKVIVKIDGEVSEEFSLSENINYIIELGDGKYNTLRIQDGYAEITDASCPDQICVNHQPIQKSGESIVCLPNKLVIEIESDSARDIDAIVN